VFTGIVERLGVLDAMAPRSGGMSLRVRHDPWDTRLVPGESVAVDGVCLTVTECDKSWFACDVLAETVARSTLSRKGLGSRLNLERALRAGDRFGGHLMTGHVDGTGEVASVRPAGEDRVLEVACSAEMLSGIVLKGSVGCDGVSLTVSDVGSSSFSAHLIPFTRTATTLGGVEVGARVNIELDLIGKYVRRQIQGAGKPLSVEDLARAGFV
jgi:riboflavin synthase